MRIGFLGVQCDTANLGLAALAYSAVRIVDALATDAELVLFSVNSEDELDRMCAQLAMARERVRAVPFRHKQPAAMLNSVREIRACDVMLDFTGGDSFSDIYGTKRLLRKLFHKQLVLGAGTPLVLAPQTYGPLRHHASRRWYRHVVDHAALVFTRDEPSAHFLAGLTDRPVSIATDVAVQLPWSPAPQSPGTGSSRNVGLNVSGLLWAGGYTGANQFDLSVDYRRWCHQVAEGLLRAGHSVWLVPHVLSRPWESAAEDDVRASKALQRLLPDCRLSPHFRSPVEAKSWISGLDLFIGSRMHATIASFTSGVPTIPAAYSRKFAGFFQNLGYPVLVDLANTTTPEAVAATLTFATDPERLREKAAPATDLIAERTTRFTEQLTTLLTAAAQRHDARTART